MESVGDAEKVGDLLTTTTVGEDVGTVGDLDVGDAESVGDAVVGSAVGETEGLMIGARVGPPVGESVPSFGFDTHAHTSRFWSLHPLLIVAPALHASPAVFPNTPYVQS